MRELRFWFYVFICISTYIYIYVCNLTYIYICVRGNSLIRKHEILLENPKDALTFWIFRT